MGPRNSLTMTLQKGGRIEEADELLQLNLELNLKLRGDGDGGALTALGNLGFLMLQDGRAEEAFDLNDEALRLGPAALGEDSSQLGFARKRLDAALHAQ